MRYYEKTEPVSGSLSLFNYEKDTNLYQNSSSDDGDEEEYMFHVSRCKQPKVRINILFT